jgi:hypothetical protein
MTPVTPNIQKMREILATIRRKEGELPATLAEVRQAIADLAALYPSLSEIEEREADGIMHALAKIEATDALAEEMGIPYPYYSPAPTKSHHKISHKARGRYKDE